MEARDDGDGVEFRLLRCLHCGAVHFDPPPAVPPPDAGQVDMLAVQHYVEVGAGIGTIHSRVFSVVDERFRGTLLDVGCGLGFGADMAEMLTEGRGIGVEPSPVGQVGAAMLGLDIHRGVLGECPELAGQMFECILASEVLEHVQDPLAFLAELRSHLTRKGVVLLTTPNAAVLAPSSVNRSWFEPVLSVGSHVILYTAEALHRLLRASGFRRIRVREQGESLVAVASDSWIRLRKPSQKGLFEYYRRREESTGEGADSLRAGMAYRRFRDLVNHGRLAEARPLYEAVEVPDAWPALSTPKEFRSFMTFCAPCHSYYRAMVDLKVGDARAAVAFAHARNLLETKIRVLPSSSPEERSLLGLAVYHEALAWKAQGESALSRAALEALRDEPRALSDHAWLPAAVSRLEASL